MTCLDDLSSVTVLDIMDEALSETVRRHRSGMSNTPAPSIAQVEVVLKAAQTVLNREEDDAEAS